MREDGRDKRGRQRVWQLGQGKAGGRTNEGWQSCGKGNREVYGRGRGWGSWRWAKARIGQLLGGRSQDRASNGCEGKTTGQIGGGKAEELIIGGLERKGKRLGDCDWLVREGKCAEICGLERQRMDEGQRVSGLWVGAGQGRQSKGGAEADAIGG